MSAVLKWLLSPVFLVWLVVMFVGFILYILVDDGPKAAWCEFKLLCEAVADDCKSFFGGY